MGLNGPTESDIENTPSEEIQSNIITESQQNIGDDADEEFDDSDEAKDQRFTEGEALKFIRVRFPGNAKSQPFLLGKRSFIYGQKVLAMSDRGMTVGYVNSFPYERPFTKSMLPLRTISKLASQEEIDKQASYIQQEREAATTCNRLIEKYRLEMNLTHVEFMQFGKKVVFYFNAPARVDFRDLVKELVGVLKMRVELRQISVRDRTAALGAIGVCGLQTCCSSFLKNYGHVSIKMAKNQNLALIPSKINGICGQIKCCIKYEDEVYTDKRSLLPREGTFIETKNGDRGRVERLQIFIEQFDMLTDRGVRKRYARNQYDKHIKLPGEWKFPERFDHITNETSNVIGLAEEEKLQALRYQQMWQDQEDDEELDDEFADNSDESEDSEDNDSDSEESDQTDESEESDEPSDDAHESNTTHSEQSRANSNRSSDENQHRNEGQNQRNRNNRNRQRSNGNRQNQEPRNASAQAPSEAGNARDGQKKRRRNRNRKRSRGPGNSNSGGGESSNS